MTCLKTLLTCIQFGSPKSCQEMIDSMDVKKLNKRVRLNLPRYSDLTVTPLLWATMLKRHCSIDHLLKKGVKPNKTGHYHDLGVMFVYSPLLKAVENGDLESVNLLLEAGADPQASVVGPFMMEEEGGSVQWQRTLTPLQQSLIEGKCNNVHIVESLLRHSHINKAMDDKGHTCLCTAIKLYWYGYFEPSELNIDYIIRIVLHGGTLCAGSLFDGVVQCEYLKALLSHTFHIEISRSESGQKTGELSIAKSYLDAVKGLLFTDYLHENSTVFKTIRHFLTLLERQFKLVFKNKESESDYAWLSSQCNTPATLQHICRVNIRNSFKKFSAERCNELPLPKQLHEYLVLVNVPAPSLDTTDLGNNV